MVCSYAKLTQKTKKLWGLKRGENKKWQTEHRTATTTYPCYLPVLGEFSRSWSCRFAVAKVTNARQFPQGSFQSRQIYVKLKGIYFNKPIVL